jgi:hypothetical protein
MMWSSGSERYDVEDEQDAAIPQKLRLVSI